MVYTLKTTLISFTFHRPAVTTYRVALLGSASQGTIKIINIPNSTRPSFLLQTFWHSFYSLASVLYFPPSFTSNSLVLRLPSFQNNIPISPASCPLFHYASLFLYPLYTLLLLFFFFPYFRSLQLPFAFFISSPSSLPSFHNNP